MHSANSASTSVADALLGLFPEAEAQEDVSGVAAVVYEVYNCTGTPPMGRDESITVPLTMTLVSRNIMNHFPAWWQAMKALRSRHAGWQFPGPPCTNVVFTLQPMTLGMHSEMPTTEKELAAEELATTGKGLTIANFVLSLEMAPRLEPADTQALGRLFGSVMGAGAAVDENCAVVKVHVFGDIYRASLVSRLCSAFACAQRADALALHLGLLGAFPEERTRIWECLAFALFSSHARARSSIRGLKLKGVTLAMVDVTAIAAVLASNDPANLLFGRTSETNSNTTIKDGETDGSPATERAMGMLKRGTTVTLVPVEVDDEMPEDAATWTLASDVHDVTVLQGDEDVGSEVSRVLLPGYGVCTVQQDQVIPSSAQLVQGGVRSLRLKFEFADGTTEGLPRFMELVGAPLKQLSLEVPPALPTRLPDLMRSCPNLQKVSFRGDPVNTKAFLAMHRECGMPLEQVDCHFDEMEVMYEELADTSTPLARTLRSMSCFFDNTGEVRQRSGRLDCVASMLRANRRLEHMQLVVPPAMYDDVLAELNGFNNKAIPVVLKLFPLEGRLAFLSVFKASSGGRSSKCLKTENSAAKPRASSVLADFALDRLVLDTIFRFAGTPMLRQVHVTPAKMIRV